MHILQQAKNTGPTSVKVTLTNLAGALIPAASACQVHHMHVLHRWPHEHALLWNHVPHSICMSPHYFAGFRSDGSIISISPWGLSTCTQWPALGRTCTRNCPGWLWSADCWASSSWDMVCLVHLHASSHTMISNKALQWCKSKIHDDMSGHGWMCYSTCQASCFQQW